MVSVPTVLRTYFFHGVFSFCRGAWELWGGGLRSCLGQPVGHGHLGNYLQEKGAKMKRNGDRTFNVYTLYWVTHLVNLKDAKERRTRQLHFLQLPRPSNFLFILCNFTFFTWWRTANPEQLIVIVRDPQLIPINRLLPKMINWRNPTSRK